MKIILLAVAFIIPLMRNTACAENIKARQTETGIWEADFADLCVPKMTQPMPGATLSHIIKALSRRFTRPSLQLRQVSNHSVEVDIIDGDYLAEQMGSTGAALFLIAATFSLTSVKGIHAVRFFFEEGSHARPGIFNRRSILLDFGCKVKP